MSERLIKLERNWPEIWRARRAVILVAIPVAIASFAAGRFWYSGEVAALRERLSLKEDQLAEYKEKLQGRSPDEVQARVNALEKTIKALMQTSPGSLDPEQKRLFSGAIRLPQNEHRTVEISAESACDDCWRYASSLGSVLNHVKRWTVIPTPVQVAAGGLGSPKGLSVLAQDPGNLSSTEALVVRGLDEAKIPHGINKAPAPPWLGPDILQLLMVPDVQLLVTDVARD